MSQVNTGAVVRGDESAFPANVDPLLLAHWQKAWRALAEFVLLVCMYVCIDGCMDACKKAIMYACVYTGTT